MIHYKIKKSDSPEYWTGYSSTFSKNGVAYRTLEDAGAAIQAQLKNSRNGIKTWVDDAQVIAFEVVTNVICSYTLVNSVELSKMFDSMQKDHGRNFLNGFKHVILKHPDLEFKYAAQIPASEFTSFRDQMKALGFSSRHYRKHQDWIYFSDDDLCLRVKLVSIHTKFVNLEAYVDQYNHNTESTPADSSLLDDAVFDDDCEEVNDDV